MARKNGVLARAFIDTISVLSSRLKDKIQGPKYAYYEATKKREKRYFKPCLKSSEGIFLHLGCQLAASMIGQMRGKQAAPSFF
jgi:hypothetical protein